MAIKAEVVETEEDESKANRVYFALGVSFLAIAGALYLWQRRGGCGCGESGTEEIARASAEMKKREESGE